MIKHFFYFLILVAVCLAISCSQIKASKTLQTESYVEDTAYIFDAKNWGTTKSDIATLAVIQGIVNRHGPRLFIINYQERDWSHTYYRNGVNQADVEFIKYFSQKYHYNFVTIEKLSSLLTLLKPQFKNVLIFPEDSAKDAKMYISLTYASLHNLIPVSQKLYRNNEWLRRLYPHPVNIDNLCAFSEHAAIYQWAIKNLMPLTDLNVAFSDNHDSLAGSDFVAKNKGFFFRTNYSLPEEIILAGKILRSLTPLASIFGWGDPSEHEYAPFLSSLGYVPYASHSFNLSFFTHNFEKIATWKQKTSTVGDYFSSSTRTLVAFLLAEGDTPKVVKSLYGGHWKSACRGRVPLNWGINPRFTQMLPALFSYYYDTASPLDSFFAPASGAGYMFFGYLPKHLHSLYLDQTTQYMGISDTKYIDLWFWDQYYYRHKRDFNNIELTNLVYTLSAHNPLVKGLVIAEKYSEMHQQKIANLPVVRSELYYWKNPEGNFFHEQQQAPQALAEAIKKRQEEGGISQVIVYLDLANIDIPCLVMQTEFLLGDTFEVVTLDKLFANL